MKRVKTKKLGCDLCGDNTPPIHLHAKCHLTAPLRAEIDKGMLTLYCYLPECNRVVARFKIFRCRHQIV